MSKVLFNNRGLLFKYDINRNIYIVVKNTTEKEFDNPLIAWRRYIEMLDNMVTKQIGNMLEKQGKNRYTGLPEVTLKEIDK